MNSNPNNKIIHATFCNVTISGIKLIETSYYILHGFKMHYYTIIINVCNSF